MNMFVTVPTTHFITKVGAMAKAGTSAPTMLAAVNLLHGEVCRQLARCIQSAARDHAVVRVSRNQPWMSCSASTQTAKQSSALCVPLQQCAD